MINLPILKVVRFLLIVTFIFFSAELFASAPLDGKYAKAPRVSASQEEKAHASSEARSKVIEASKKYLGIPYVYGGMNIKGMDCSGFICLSFKDALNVSLPRSASGLYSWAEKINFDKAQPGDLLFFRTGNDQSITHVAIYLGNLNFIHSASAGAVTGVIYSNLKESYWANAFAGAGRALPEAQIGFTDSGFADSNTGEQDNLAAVGGEKKYSNFITGFGIAPTWDFLKKSGKVIRGFTSQIYIGAEFSKWLSFGIELRPEYDGIFHDLRLPLTLSWGHRDYFRIFAGPVLRIHLSDSHFSSKTSWLGIAGLTITPFNINLSRHQITPYIELSWQSYFNKEQDMYFFEDISSSFHFAFGLRWKMHI